MSTDSTERLHPTVFIVGGAVALALLGFVVDVTLGGGASFSVDGPLSDLTTYNFTLLGALGGAILGGFVGFGLI